MKKRELTRNEKKIANKLCAILTGMDRCVFPDKPMINVELVLCRPRKGSGHIAYQPQMKNSKQAECYVIFGYGIDQFVKTLKTQRRIIIWGQRTKKHKIKDYEIIDKTNPLATEEVLSGLAAHEVRHRLQFLHKVQMITRRCIHKKTDPYLWILKKITEYYTKNLVYYTHNRRKYAALEFDASMVQYLFISLLHYGIKTNSEDQAMQQMIAVIKIKPSQLRKKFLFNDVPIFKP